MAFKILTIEKLPEYRSYLQRHLHLAQKERRFPATQAAQWGPRHLCPYPTNSSGFLTPLTHHHRHKKMRNITNSALALRRLPRSGQPPWTSVTYSKSCCSSKPRGDAALFMSPKPAKFNFLKAVNQTHHCEILKKIINYHMLSNC